MTVLHPGSPRNRSKYTRPFSPRGGWVWERDYCTLCDVDVEDVGIDSACDSICINFVLQSMCNDEMLNVGLGTTEEGGRN